MKKVYRYAKNNITINTDTYKKFKRFKAKEGFKFMDDALDYLVEFYYSKKGGK